MRSAPSIEPSSKRCWHLSGKLFRTNPGPWSGGGFGGGPLLALLRSMASSPAAAASTLTTRAFNLDAETPGKQTNKVALSVMDIGDDRDAL